jgi:hypothetical protein
MRAPVVLVAAALVAGLVACGDDDRSPNPAAPSIFLGPPKNLQVSGDISSASVGQSRQFSATATFANGTTHTVTNLATWTSSNTAVATVSRGFVRIVGAGETQISATYRDVTSALAPLSARAILTGVSIVGPAEVAPGSITQFTATGAFSDGSSGDVTAEVTWISVDSAMRHVGSGRFEALRVGDSRVGGNFSGRSISKAVIVVPAGTFKLSGFIRDNTGAVSDADVEVVSGTGTGLRAKSAFNGAYALYGVEGQVQVRVSMPGYLTQELSVTVSSHTARDVSIVTDGETAIISGEWTLTVSTSGACSETWPADVRRREVGARITQQGTRLTINFLNVTNFVYETTGRIAGAAFSMTLYYDDYYLDWGLMQRVSPTDWVGVNGEFRGTVNGPSIQGTLTGIFHYYLTNASAQGPGGNPRSCPADSTFAFRR